jgi:alkylhydroperoxidase/carboxymuconolactone decarboxylase family protein YurZ
MDAHASLHKFTRDVTKILTKQELKALRGAYDASLLSDLATQAVVDKFPASGLWVGTIQRILFEDPENGGKPLLQIGAPERELCLIALMSAEGMRLELGVHIYWGLMEGLKPKQIAALMTLVGVYAGLDRFNAALGVMTTALRALCTAAEAGKVSVPDVLPILIGAFEPAAPAPAAAPAASAPAQPVAATSSGGDH